jgi:hypothetical protein
MYQAIWPEETFKQFKTYMNSAFGTFQGGVGGDAPIRATTFEKKVAYEKSGKEWLGKWDKQFTEKRDPEHKVKYEALMNLISRDLMYLPVNTGNQK